MYYYCTTFDVISSRILSMAVRNILHAIIVIVFVKFDDKKIGAAVPWSHERTCVAPTSTSPGNSFSPSQGEIASTQKRKQKSDGFQHSGGVLLRRAQHIPAPSLNIVDKYPCFDHAPVSRPRRVGSLFTSTNSFKYADIHT